MSHIPHPNVPDCSQSNPGATPPPNGMSMELVNTVLNAHSIALHGTGGVCDNLTKLWDTVRLLLDRIETVENELKEARVAAATGHARQTSEPRDERDIPPASHTEVPAPPIEDIAATLELNPISNGLTPSTSTQPEAESANARATDRGNEPVLTLRPPPLPEEQSVQPTPNQEKLVIKRLRKRDSLYALATSRELRDRSSINPVKQLTIESPPNKRQPVPSGIQQAKKRQKLNAHIRLEVATVVNNVGTTHDDQTGTELIFCEVCSHWYHMECTGLAQDDPCLTDDNVSYICRSCIERPRSRLRQADQSKCGRLGCTKPIHVEEEYSIESLIGRRVPLDTRSSQPNFDAAEYLVKWEGYPISASEWLPRAHIGKLAPVLLERFLTTLEAEQGPQRIKQAGLFLLQEAVEGGW